MSPGWEGNLFGPLQIQLLGFCTEAHPGWDNLSGGRDAELLDNTVRLEGVATASEKTVRCGER